MSEPTQMTIESMASAIEGISALMSENRAYLVKLDQANGDGDLGISMDDGFSSLVTYFRGSAAPSSDLGQALRGAAKVFNSAAPSSLGTIISFGFMGMAKALRGSSSASFDAVASAAESGLRNIMEKAESQPGEKTILDSLHPGVQSLLDSAQALGADPSVAQVKAAWKEAAEAAAKGADSTREMEAVHGRAAYSKSRSVGILDGGSVVGALIFEGVSTTL